jgi:uncharacterized protein YecT (DUF1311 family)
MKTSFVTVLACVLLSAHVATPVRADGETPEFRKCMDAVDLGAFKNSQWASCYEAELKRQDRALNAVYQQIQKQASPELKQSLTKGQRAWLAYRDAWCAYEEQTPVAPGGIVNKMACLVDVTIAQIKRLKDSSAD